MKKLTVWENIPLSQGLRMLFEETKGDHKIVHIVILKNSTDKLFRFEIEKQG